jgi:hypothetical protein
MMGLALKQVERKGGGEGGEMLEGGKGTRGVGTIEIEMLDASYQL